jgi:hypothetical protein
MKALATIALVFLAGCATTAKYEARVDTWQGKDAHVLTSSWGQPDAIEKLSNGNKIYLYSRLKHLPYAYGESHRVIASTQDAMYIKCATYFVVTQQGKVVATMFRGDECRSKD